VLQISSSDNNKYCGLALRKGIGAQFVTVCSSRKELRFML
jgi:hypothetical protein